VSPLSDGAGARTRSLAGQLARLGFDDVTRAEATLKSAGLEPIRNSDLAVEAFAFAASPDLALELFARLAQAALECGECGDLFASFVDDSGFRQRLVVVLGASEALGEFLCRHPDQWHVLIDDASALVRPSADELRDDLVGALGLIDRSATDWETSAVGLRIAYRRRLLQLAARDLSGIASFRDVTGELADLADAVLAACLELAASQLDPGATPCRLSIIAMGKCGGRELNYVSDVDVIFVAAPTLLPSGEIADEAEALKTATLLARGVMKAANEPTSEGSIWEVDAALRPEGKSGALVRTLASHLGYYSRWAQTWEFQALLKARYAAGDQELGEQYVDAVMPLVWSAAQRPDFVADVQKMRRRVEKVAAKRDNSRELKLGQGGLRDVEFSVQLLQLVHGRTDVMLRSSTTLAALDAMALWGYVGREDAATLTSAYRFLRTLEHRVQLFRLQRTHVVPADDKSLRRIGRSMGYRRDPATELTEDWAKHRVAVRRLHEKLFYRPLLNAVARLAPGDARLTREAAIERLTALGYADPSGALRHLEMLTSGVSRRAAIQRTLLPVLLGWFAAAPNPDAGLLAFRRVSENLGATPWYLRLLRDESETAERMAHLLATSRYATDLLLRSPDTVAMLSRVEDLQPRTYPEIAAELDAMLLRQDDSVTAMESVRLLRRRELFRIAAGDISDELTIDQVGPAISDITDVTLQGALRIAEFNIGSDATDIAVIGLGRLGGREAGYSSDADVIFVNETRHGATEHEATKAAIAIANEMRRLLGLPSADNPLELDTDLRPEGRSGALVRSLDSYRAYYSRWSSPWEAQALLRARPVAGDAALGQKFLDVINPLRWPSNGISEEDLREMRRIKARMEAERLPRGADPATHVKLGRGGLSDVEWVAQLMQLRFAGTDSGLSPSVLEGLRSTSTLTVLAAATAGGLIDPDDESVLADAWRLASRIRNSVYLVTGRSSDQLPADTGVLAGVGYLLGYPARRGSQLAEDYMKVSRKSRAVMERIFYDWADEPPELS